jgi:serine/threonine protein kinase
MSEKLRSTNFPHKTNRARDGAGGSSGSTTITDSNTSSSNSNVQKSDKRKPLRSSSSSSATFILPERLRALYSATPDLDEETSEVTEGRDIGEIQWKQFLTYFMRLRSLEGSIQAEYPNVWFAALDGNSTLKPVQRGGSVLLGFSYDEVEPLGSGGFGKVFLVREALTDSKNSVVLGSERALKVAMADDAFAKERAIMHLLKTGPNIVQISSSHTTTLPDPEFPSWSWLEMSMPWLQIFHLLQKSYRTDGTYVSPSKYGYISMNSANRGNLEEFFAQTLPHLQQQGRNVLFMFSDRHSMALQIGTALAYMHQRSLVHADLHSKNILLHTDSSPLSGSPEFLDRAMTMGTFWKHLPPIAETGEQGPLQIFVTDFGLSQRIPRGYFGLTLEAPTAAISGRPPESIFFTATEEFDVNKRRIYVNWLTPKFDCWSYGVLLFRLLDRRNRDPFSQSTWLFTIPTDPALQLSSNQLFNLWPDTRIGIQNVSTPTSTQSFPTLREPIENEQYKNFLRQYRVKYPSRASVEQKKAHFDEVVQSILFHRAFIVWTKTTEVGKQQLRYTQQGDALVLDRIWRAISVLGWDKLKEWCISIAGSSSLGESEAETETSIPLYHFCAHIARTKIRTYYPNFEYNKNSRIMQMLDLSYASETEMDQKTRGRIERLLDGTLQWDSERRWSAEKIVRSLQKISPLVSLSSAHANTDSDEGDALLPSDIKEESDTTNISSPLVNSSSDNATKTMKNTYWTRKNESTYFPMDKTLQQFRKNIFALSAQQLVPMRKKCDVCHDLLAIHALKTRKAEVGKRYCSTQCFAVDMKIK